MEPLSVSRFREYLQIQTVHPTPDYEKCTEYLKNQAAEIGLEYRAIEYVPGKAVVIMTWVGSKPELSSIILNSHTDVVPVFEEFWDYPPFSAARIPTEDGDFKIYARGSQDMKVVGSCYLEAIRNLKAANFQPTRTLHLTFVPDEEIGGKDGMAKFVDSQDFKDLDAGFALDEGIANPGPELYAFYAERCSTQVRYTTHGETGHGSQFIPNTAISKMMAISKELLEFRDSEENKLITQYGEITQSNLGEVTTVNLNIFNGGVQTNVVPESFSAVFDIRVTPNRSITEFNEYLHSIAKKYDAEIENLGPVNEGAFTDISSDNQFWGALTKVVEKRGLKTINAIFPAATDSRYLRGIGIPAIGISYLKDIPVLLHVHNEYITESLFLDGIDFYTDLIHSLSIIE
ncbi:hypothetical protein BB561_005731 [Smittium simulii]|uniref:Peptidase M20 dimerisation domain-containing protein n=1 Tax=Smittium simulii TaxID=133385 RepID=A0A2T9Y8P6_9FUNG|nr:hypothetical protein BB561_005731 [Smittium simulii]